MKPSINENQKSEAYEHLPERDLWCAVLEQAVIDYKKGLFRNELAIFFFGDGENNQWFRQICHFVDIDPSKFREGLRSWKES
jgi:hypothetical protein